MMSLFLAGVWVKWLKGNSEIKLRYMEKQGLSELETGIYMEKNTSTSVLQKKAYKLENLRDIKLERWI